jgi:hypothetical protein
MMEMIIHGILEIFVSFHLSKIDTMGGATPRRTVACD